MAATLVKFCGKPLSTEDLDLIKELAAEFWGISRTELASTICELLGWRRQNGKLKTVECGHFLLDLADQEILPLVKPILNTTVKSGG